MGMTHASGNPINKEALWIYLGFIRNTHTHIRFQVLSKTGSQIQYIIYMGLEVRELDLHSVFGSLNYVSFIL